MTDHYAQVEQAFIAKARTLTQLFPKEHQVSDDDSVLNRGGDYFLIVQPDAFPGTRVDGRAVFFNWIILADLYVRYKSRKESLSKFKAARSALINLFHPASLNGTANVSRVVISANGGLQQDIPGDNPNFIIQTFSVAVTQRVNFM